jgi:hypothetical protein
VTYELDENGKAIIPKPYRHPNRVVISDEEIQRIIRSVEHDSSDDESLSDQSNKMGAHGTHLDNFSKVTANLQLSINEPLKSTLFPPSKKNSASRLDILGGSLGSS